MEVYKYVCSCSLYYYTSYVCVLMCLMYTNVQGHLQFASIRITMTKSHNTGPVCTDLPAACGASYKLQMGPGCVQSPALLTAAHVIVQATCTGVKGLFSLGCYENTQELWSCSCRWLKTSCVFVLAHRMTAANPIELIAAQYCTARQLSPHWKRQSPVSIHSDRQALSIMNIITATGRDFHMSWNE